MSLNEKEIQKSDHSIDLGGFTMRDNLNPKVWTKDETMKPDVKKTLLKIADDYFESLDLPGVDIEDVTMTGSLANYNWSKYSDVDLHIIIDYNDLDMDEDRTMDYLKSKSDSWNDQHDIKIYGFDVEIYVQDREAEHTSTGVYSILNNEWNVKPEKKKISFNDQSVKDKASRLMDAIDGLYDKLGETDDFDTVSELGDKIKNKIKKMRQCGLDEGGEWSVENIVFKVLRRNGMLERLYDIKTVAYDKSVTLESITESEDDLDWIRGSLTVGTPYSETNTTPYAGDTVICLPGFSNNNNGHDNPNINPDYGGAGYEEGAVYTVNNRSYQGGKYHTSKAINVEEVSNGIFLRALAPANTSITEGDDLTWMDEIPSQYEPSVGDTVTITNNGDTQAYKEWLGVFSHLHMDTLTGVVVKVQDDNSFAINNGNTHIGDDDYIWFPKLNKDGKPIDEGVREGHPNLDISYVLS